jgi:aspartyl protease family protein
MSQRGWPALFVCRWRLSGCHKAATFWLARAKRYPLITGLLLLLAAPPVLAQTDSSAGVSATPLPIPVVVKALFPGRAFLMVQGAPRLLKDGQSSPDGITLVRATSQFAQIRYGGQLYSLSLNRQVGADYGQARPARTELKRDRDGHFTTPGRINNEWVEFMVDTGATAVTLNSHTASLLGIDYLNRPSVTVQTANGNTQAYPVILAAVAVGDIVVTRVDALVIDGRFPKTLLLGNSFLSRVKLAQDDNLLTLEAHF